MSRDPRALKASLSRVTESLGAGDALSLAAVFSEWPDLVGEGLAARARPAAIRQRTLVVAVDDPAWATQLRWITSSVLERLNQAIPTACFDAIDIVVRAAPRRA